MYGNNCIYMVFLVLLEHFVCFFTTFLEDAFLWGETAMMPDREDCRLVGWSVNTGFRKLPQQKSIHDFGQVIYLPHISIPFGC